MTVLHAGNQHPLNKAPFDAKARSGRYAVVAPTFNNERTLLELLHRVSECQSGVAIIAVNDGSTDGTARLLGGWAAGGDQRFVREHGLNAGKAAALQTGFAAAREMGFSHAITIDTDGQHDPADIADLLAASHEHPTAIVVGARQTLPECPRASLVGKKVSNFLVLAASGVIVSDSQSGLRIYPLDPVGQLHSRQGRFAFETEVLIRAGWANVAVIERPIRCIYAVAGGRVSHFRPIFDSLAASRMHIGLLTRAVWPHRPSKLVPTTDLSATGTISERFLRWMNPFRTWRLARADMAKRERLAASVGWGLFMAYQPFFGFRR